MILFAYLIELIAVVLVLLAYFFLKISGLSTDQISAYLSARSTYGKIDWLTPDFIASAMDRFRFTAVVLLIVALVLVFFRKKIKKKFRKLFRAIKDDIPDHLKLYELKTWKEICAILLVIGVSVYFKSQLLPRALMGDEAFTILHYAKRSIPMIVANYNFPNNHVFHSLLSHFSAMVFGDHVWVYRLPAFVFGVALAPLTYFFLRRYSGAALALLAAVVVGYHSDIIFYSTQARGYTMLAYFYLLSLFLLLHFFERKNLVSLVCFVLSNILAFWTIPVWAYAFLSFVMLWAMQFYWTKTRLGVQVFGSILLGTAILYLPILLTMGPKALFANEYIAATAMGVGSSLRLNFYVFKNHVLASESLVGVSFFAVAGLVLSFLRFQESRRVLLSIIGSLLILAVFKKVEVPVRVLFFFLPVMVVYSVRGFTGLLHRFIYPLILFLLWTNSAMLQLARKDIASDFYSDVPRVADSLKQELRFGDRVYVSNPYVELFEYYFTERGMPVEALVRPLSSATRVIFVREKAVSADRDKAFVHFIEESKKNHLSVNATAQMLLKETDHLKVSVLLLK